MIRHDRFRDSILCAAFVVFASFGCASHPCAKLRDCREKRRSTRHGAAVGRMV